MLAAVIAVSLGACTQPSPTVPSTPTIVATSISGLTIAGLPSSVTVGQSFQLTAMVTLPNGSQKQSQGAVWKSSDTAGATVSSTGLLTVVAGGVTVDVTATLEDLSATRRVVVPYRVTGVVHESAPTTEVPVAGARVEVRGGSDSGTSTTTDSAGRFTLDVASAGFDLSVSKVAYDQTTVTIAALPRDEHPNITLTPSAGEVFFSISGTNACTELPNDLHPSQLRRPIVTTFPVYHSGQLVVHEVVVPGWGAKTLALYKISPDGQRLTRFTLYFGVIRTPLRVEGGYNYTAVFDAEGIFCPEPFKVVLTHPK